MKLVSLVIPVYRNEGSLHVTYDRIVALFARELTDLDYEFIFVDDGSDDASLPELLALRSADRKVKIVSFARNFGQVPAIVAGLSEAKGDAVLAMSADLQDPPEMILEMAREWRSGADVVICQRTDREDSLLAQITSRIFYGLMRVSNPRMPAGGFDYVLLDRRVNAALGRIDERNRFIQGDILWAGFDVRFLPYRRQKRPIGRSQWSLAGKTKYFIDGLVTMSYLPIRFISLLGILTASSGFLYALLIAYLRLQHSTPFTGWAPLMIVILVIGGVIMLMLGIIGEYIWRIYDETRKRPYYVVKNRYIDD